MARDVPTGGSKPAPGLTLDEWKQQNKVSFSEVDGGFQVLVEDPKEKVEVPVPAVLLFSEGTPLISTTTDAIAVARKQVGNNTNWLHQQLYLKGALSKAEFKAAVAQGGWNELTSKGVKEALAAVTSKNWTQMLRAGTSGKGMVDLMGFLKSSGSIQQGSGGQGDGSGTYKYLTNMRDEQIDDLLQGTMNDLLGAKPTAKELKEFRSILRNELANKPDVNVVAGTTQTRTAGVKPEDFTTEWVINKAREKFKADPNAKFGGKIGELQTQLKQYANSMGVAVSDRDLFSRSLSVAAQKGTTADQMKDIRTQAAALYKPFAKRLMEDPDITVRDLASPYLNMMQTYWEQDSENLSLTDPTLLKAINGGQNGEPMSLWDFQKMLRSDQRFDYTMMARQEAATVATGLLKAFGYGV